MVSACNMNNALLLKDVLTIHHPCTVFLCTVPPVIINSPPNTTIDEHSNITLECRASGNPPPMITWTHNGATVGDEEGIFNWQESNDSTSVSARIDSGLHAVTRHHGSVYALALPLA